MRSEQKLSSLWPVGAIWGVQIAYAIVKKYVKEQEMFDWVHIIFNWGLFAYFSLVVSQLWFMSLSISNSRDYMEFRHRGLSSNYYTRKRNEPTT